MEDWMIIIITTGIGITIGSILTFLITFYFYKKQRADIKTLSIKIGELRSELRNSYSIISELGKKEEIIRLKSEPEDIIPAELQPEQPSYDLSTLTTTIDPTISALFDYGKKEFGKRMIDNIVDSVFGVEETPYECPKCGTDIYSDEKYCPNCGVELEEEEEEEEY